MTRDDDGDDDLAALWETTREASEADADDHPSVSGRRATCESCGRPARACLCPNLPETPFPTRGALVILTHPNEHKRALATGWILPRCLRRCAVLTRRSPPDAFLRMLGPADAHDDTDGGVLPADAPIYLLYPAPHATDVTRVDVRADAESLRSARKGDARSACGGGGGGGALPGRISAELASTREALRDAAYLCIAVDSTWRQAREMVVRAVEALPARARLVRLPTRGSAEAPGLRRVWERSGGDVPGDEDGDARGDTRTLRVEPAEGCMLTAEAAARAMSALERGYARDGEGDGRRRRSLGRRLGGGGGDFGVAGHGEDTGGARSRDARRDGETHGRKATAHRCRRTRPPENQSRVREERKPSSRASAGV